MADSEYGKPDKPLTERLRGPPGLYDSPNRERDATGGIVQRMVVPEDTRKEILFPYGRMNNMLSMNDSDNESDMLGEDGREAATEAEKKALETGIPTCKTIRTVPNY